MSNQDNSKQTLEEEKLRLEIKRLNRKWWSDREHLRTIVTLATTLGIAFITAGIAYYNGLFDVKRERLENDRTLLKIEIAEFQDIRDDIKATNDSLRNESDSLREAMENLNAKQGRLLASLNQEREYKSALQDSVKAVQSQLKRLKSDLQEVEDKNRLAQLQLNHLNDSIEKVVGPIKDILDAQYESYVAVYWRTQMAGDDSFKIYVIDENWNLVSGAFIDILDTTNLSISGALPDSTNSKGEFGFKLRGTEHKDVILAITNNDTSPQEVPMLIGPSLRYRMLLKRRISGSE